MAKKSDGDTATITKAEAVRHALADGIDKPEDGVSFLKEKFGLTITAQQFSTYKSIEKKRAGKAPRRRAASARQSGALAAPSSNGPSGLATSVEAIKTLVEMYGVEQVVSIAQLFGK